MKVTSLDEFSFIFCSLWPDAGMAPYSESDSERQDSDGD